MHVAIIKSQLCESCTPSIRAEHISVNLKSIQLHSTSPNSADTPEWIDLAPQLRLQPRQIDLIADSTPLILVQNALVPVGTYREIRLQFAPNTSVSSGDTLPACGENHENCMLMANGNIEQLYFAGEPPELVVPLQNQRKQCTRSCAWCYPRSKAHTAAAPTLLRVRVARMASPLHAGRPRFHISLMPASPACFDFQTLYANPGEEQVAILDGCRIGSYYEPLYRLADITGQSLRVFRVSRV